MTNMKQIGLAIIGYTQDYDGKFPTGSVAANIELLYPSASVAPGQPAAKPGISHGLGIGWAGSLHPYLKSPRILCCPDDSTKEMTAASGKTLFPVSYAMNQWIAGHSISANYWHPATTVLAFECSGPLANVASPTEDGNATFSAVGDGASDPQTGIPMDGDAFNTRTGIRHLIINNQGSYARHDTNDKDGGGSFYLLGDGHVKFLRFNQVSVGNRPVSQTKLVSPLLVSFNPTD